MVYGVVKQHGAQLKIDSAPGRGTRIRICFPAPTGIAVIEPRGRAPDFTCSPLRILLIDDDPLVLGSLKDALEAEGHFITAAGNSREGVETFRRAAATCEPFAVDAN